MSRTVSRPFSALLSARTPRHGRKASSPRRRRRLWALEGLEDRVLLAATLYTVNAITDTGAGSGTTGDLLYCIDQANANSNTAGSLIQFDPTVFGTPQTITLSSTLTLSETAGPEVISGPGANLRDGQRQQQRRGVLDLRRRDGHAHRPDDLERLGHSTAVASTTRAR